MLEAIAVKELVKNNKIFGYRLKDAKGNQMDIPSQSIIDAIKNKKVIISNLTIDSTGKLVMIKKESKNNETNKEFKNKEDIKHHCQKSMQEDQSKMDRMHELIKVLNHARKVYEQGKDEVMSNFEYDKLYDELESIENELGVVMCDSPTQNIGYEVVSSLPKEKHPERIMSLAKTKELGEIQSFAGNKDVLIGWKLDGLTVVVTYENGQLAKAVTRGNGEIGELVTPNAKQFINLPKQISWKGKLVIRGEANITYGDFNKINERLPMDEKYKNPRNLASGSVRQLDSRITSQRNVRFTAFTLVEMIDTNGNKVNLTRVSEAYSEMKKLGFDVVEHMVVKSSDVARAIAAFTAKVQSGKMDQPVDGLVLTYDDIAYGKSLGTTAKTPRHSIAFKWEDECVETTLRDIEWSVGKTGVITPVAIFDPVDIEGSTVSRASLHNISVLAETLGQPYVGQRISVYKANMIIPCIAWGEKLEDLYV